MKFRLIREYFHTLCLTLVGVGFIGVGIYKSIPGFSWSEAWLIVWAINTLPVFIIGLVCLVIAWALGKDVLFMRTQPRTRE